MNPAGKKEKLIFFWFFKKKLSASIGRQYVPAVISNIQFSMS